MFRQVKGRGDPKAKHGKLGRVFAAGLAVVAAFSLMVPAIASADTVTRWPTPALNANSSNGAYSSTQYNDDGSVKSQQVLTAIYGYYTPLSQYLGVTNTISITPSSPSVLDDDYFATDGMWGMYASTASQNSDPYWTNLWLSYAYPEANISVDNGDEVALIPTERGMASANTALYGDSGVPASFYYRPDIIVSGQNAYATYAEIVAKINATGEAVVSGSATDAEDGIGLDNYQEGDESYDPYVISQANADDGGNLTGDDGIYYAAGSLNGNMQTLYSIADAVEELEVEDSTLVTRYDDDPIDIVADLEELVYGSRYYVLEQIEQGNIEKQVVAYVASVDAAEQTATLSFAEEGTVIGTVGTGSATSLFSPWFDLDGVVDNLVDILGVDTSGVEYSNHTGTITVPISDLTKADILFCTNASYSSSTTVSEADLANAFEVAGVAEADRPIGYFNNPTDLGMGGWNSDRICFMPAWIGFMYPELASASEMMAYYYYYTCHVNEDWIDDALALNCSKLTLRSDDSLDVPSAGYEATFAEIKAKLVEGMTYYYANTDAIEAIGENLAAPRDGDGEFRNPRYAAGTYDVTDDTTPGDDGSDEPTTITFPDVAEVTVDNEWYYNAVYYVANLGLMTGYNEDAGDMAGYFGVGMSMTRAEFAMVLCRIAGADESPAANATGMADVVDNSWYSGAVNWAVANGVVTGYDNGDGTHSFKPDQAISMQEMALMLQRYLAPNTTYGTDALASFPDASSVDSWATNGVAWAVSVGLINGYEEDDGTYTLQPTVSILRERAATILYRAYESGLLQ